MAEWRILVVEDDEYSQDVASTILQYHGVTVDVVATAEEGISLLARKQYHAAIIDLSLPEMDGWGLLRYIKSEPALVQMPCIAVTAYYSSQVAQQALESGFSAFFPKPLLPESFVQDLAQFL
jgi:CheY-like chemotaxis protein